MDSNNHVKNIVVDIILTIITFGLFNIWVQYRQMQSVNQMQNEREFSFLLWSILCLFTFGLYHIYHEYVMSETIAKALNRPPGTDGVLAIILTIIGLHWIEDAIEQSHINRFFHKR
jgi:uncharacterized membrane protein YjgN (DUF898 family)